MVNRCVCHNVLFSRVLALAAAGRTLAEIVETTGCGGGCGTCRPYVREALATGRVVLPVLSAARCAAILAERPWPAVPGGGATAPANPGAAPRAVDRPLFPT